MHKLYKSKEYLDNILNNYDKIMKKISEINTMLDIIINMIEIAKQKNIPLQKINLSQIRLNNIDERYNEIRETYKIFIKAFFDEIIPNFDCEEIIYKYEIMQNIVEKVKNFDLNFFKLFIQSCNFSSCKVIDFIKEDTLNDILKKYNILIDYFEKFKQIYNIKTDSNCLSDIMFLSCTDTSGVLTDLQRIYTLASSLSKAAGCREVYSFPIFTHICATIDQLVNINKQIEDKIRSCTIFIEFNKIVSEYQQVIQRFSEISQRLMQLARLQYLPVTALLKLMKNIEQLISSLSNYSVNADHLTALLGNMRELDKIILDQILSKLNQSQRELYFEFIENGKINIEDLPEEKIRDLYKLCKMKLINCVLNL